MQVLLESFISAWQALVSDEDRTTLIDALEAGKILYFYSLAFSFSDFEKKFLSPHWLDGSRKNISLQGDTVRGARGDESDLQQLATMMSRFAGQATQLVQTLFPQYGEQLRTARTSYRPARVTHRKASWRKDDSRLHVDAFPSRPSHGERILRVFTNVNPHGEARVWQAGESFADAAQHFLPRIRKPLPGSAALMAALGITKGKRSEYDHIMLHLHDEMKADSEYQRCAQQQRIEFPPGTTWVCFSDQVLHAALEGQYLLEHTVHVPVSAQQHPECSPLHMLENLIGRQLT
ncbi:MAG: 3-deoxy-D-manno-oct-2-ulosonic acid (Kdo) hydroxylase [Verrucomicrobiaceae bacterium]|nr:3-deoxy-D-manno-oct-2-ulosonic acid (Kdo) hydroxylase [Verrucomicrobiaceae bacterium]